MIAGVQRSVRTITTTRDTNTEGLGTRVAHLAA